MITIGSPDFDIRKIADSGQCFRLNEKDGYYFNVAGDKTLRIYGNKLDCTKKEYNAFWKAYFDLESDYSSYRESIPESDSFLSAAADFGTGIRILRQDPWEMLITFIISQRKNIPAIKACVEKICSLFGDEIGEDAGETIYAFPTVSQLAAADEKDLCTCSLGYRLPYIISAARMVDDGKLDLKMLYNYDNAALLDALMDVKGVGIKVANCIALFAYHRIDSFPIDVWIQRVLDQYYKDGFPFELYKGFEGIMQQYMFYYIRNN